MFRKSSAYIDELCDDVICFGCLDCHKRFCYKTWIMESKILPVISASCLAFSDLTHKKLRIIKTNQNNTKCTGIHLFLK